MILKPVNGKMEQFVFINAANRFDFPDNEDLYEYACEDEGLGEIRSIYLAKKLGYHYFMSDDGGARRLATSFWKSPEVLNVYDALIKCKANGTSITLKQLNSTISNVFRDRQNKLKVLQELYAREVLVHETTP